MSRHLFQRLLHRLFRRRDRIAFAGEHATWAEAVRHSTGYDAAVILERTRAAQLKIQRGEAVFERDSVIFAKPEWPWPVLACLLRIAGENGGRLSVLDFGGALGSTYFSCRPFFQSLAALRWSVVEQPGYVACGQQEFQNDQLAFYRSLADCLARERPDVVLLSGVLQYLEHPMSLLASLPATGVRYLLLDRTTVFKDATPDRLTVQTVPESIYPASYPCWMFNYARMMATLAPAYELVAEFPAHEGVTMRFENRTCAVYAGMLWQRKPTPELEAKPR